MSWKLLFRILLGLYLAALLFLCFGRFSSLPSVPWTIWGIPSDKVMHFFLFIPFPVLAFLAFYRKKAPFLLFLAVLACGCLLAMGTELGQRYLTTYRFGDRKDFLADVLGLAAGSLPLLVWLIFRKRR